MPATSEIILSATTHPGDSTVETVVGEKFKGDGYYGRSDGFHTVQMNVNGVAGTIKIQGTLAGTPVSTDWVDIESIVTSDGSSAITANDLWFDTDDGQVYWRNAANNAFR